ncbi:histidine phosphotransferase family protein [Acidimangrovimonas pyrenivorans]|uniref:Histidine phosphotransferase family protein n=1 Tax=Acidimangrovimonas pyrenivorans TaxID=2030798 RepID=A0ABV7AEB7_9RHOB
MTVPAVPPAPQLSALVGSRICHDLIGPLGAIGNGIELLGLDGAGGGAELDLITQSVRNAHARIRFFRIAFGAAAADARLGRPEIVAILADLTATGRLKADWHVPGDLPRREVKLAFLALQCLETAMPFGGRVTFSADARGWEARGRAPRLQPDPALWKLLEGTAAPEAAELSAAQVQYALLPLELARQQRRLTAELEDGALRLRW